MVWNFPRTYGRVQSALPDRGFLMTAYNNLKLKTYSSWTDAY